MSKSSFLTMFEKVLFAVLAVVIGLSLFTSVNVRSVIIVTMSALAGVFFIYSRQVIPREEQEGEKHRFIDLLGAQIGPRILWMASAISLVGILFEWMHFQGYRQMVVIGCITAVVALAFAGVAFALRTKSIDRIPPVLYRAVPILLVDIYILLR